MNYLCRLLNHKWHYDPYNPCTWRKCKRCNIKQKYDYSGDIIREGVKFK